MCMCICICICMYMYMYRERSGRRRRLHGQRAGHRRAREDAAVHAGGSFGAL